MNGRFLTSVIWTILTLFIVVGLAFLWAVIFSIVLILLFNILVSVFNKQSAAEGEFALVAAGMFLGILSTPLSLLPSYKLSLKLAEWIEKKWGVAVDN
ncbi:hypothetical protein KJ596_01205, partial [Patescibacteria group bacterium]|nr:hypothetical protein [Patescibacteria group bacterium]MBU1868136.1 hypothetical protein [Patescibacteria group bacterium]